MTQSKCDSCATTRGSCPALMDVSHLLNDDLRMNEAEFRQSLCDDAYVEKEDESADS